jgi:predicted ATP-dependent endonuclease of OLD family
MSEHFFSKVEIKNFKSIENIEFECKRINLFVGKPNVGKSCIIEALSLLAKPDLLLNYDLKYLINFESYHNLFHNNIVHNEIIVKTDKSLAFINYENKFQFLKSNNSKLLLDSNKYLFSTYKNYRELFGVFKQSEGNTDLALKTLYNIENFVNYQISEQSNTGFGFTNPYKFIANSDYTKMDNLILKTPLGDNLFWIISQSDILQDEISAYLSDYNLDLVYDASENKFEIQKRKRSTVYKTPYSLIADTLQRLIFYTAAIYSNDNSILLFEEPEVNSFPPYIRELANKILLSKTNQFFITTHSPYLLTTLLEDSGMEVMMNVVGYKDGKTTIHQTSSDEISELLSYDSDIFLNIDRYI